MRAIPTGFIRRTLSAILSENGYFIDTGCDMASWCDVVTTHGGHPNPQFDPALFPQTGGYMSIYETETRSLASTIAWRSIDTDDYLEDMREGTAWFPVPDAVDWRPLVLDGASRPSIRGRVHCRGALFSPKRNARERRGGSGQRLSWYLTNLMWCMHAETAADFVVSHAHVDIVENGLPRRLYGYARAVPMPHHNWPFHGVATPAYMVWSSALDIEAHLIGLSGFLRQYKSTDLRQLAGAHSAYVESQSRRAPQVVELGRPSEAARVLATA